MLSAHNFQYGLLTPVTGYLLSCLGAFLGLRCTTRARAYHGPTRARWLLLAAVSIGAMGIWVTHFIAMLGFTIPGQTIRYNVQVTILSMLIAVAVVGAGLFIVSFGRAAWWNLVLAGVITGIGVASMHYTGMAAMRMPARMTYNPSPVRSFGDHRGRGRDRGVLGGAAAARHPVNPRGRHDHGRGRQRHALHRNGRNARPARTSGLPDEHGRRHRRRVPASSSSAGSRS